MITIDFNSGLMPSTFLQGEEVAASWAGVSPTLEVI